MSQGNDFANYASSVEDRSSASEDVWFVAVSSDDIKQMNVDQLDEAFRLGVITAQTAVWTEGMEAWAPLGEVADLDSEGDSSSESAEAEPPASAPFSASTFSQPAGDPSYAGSSHGASSYAPSASSHADASHHADASQRDRSNAGGMSSQRRTNPGWQNPFDAPESIAPRASNGAMSPSSIFSEPPRAGSLSTSSMGPNSFAPVTASYAPSATGSLQSTGPVALNVDEDMPPINRGRRFRPERWLLAAAGVAAIGVIAYNNADLLSSKSMAAAEKQASAAALVARPYEVAADKSGAAKGGESAAVPADEGKDAPIGSLKGEAGEEAEPATAVASLDSLSKQGSKGSSSKDSESGKDLRGGFAKAFSKAAPAAKPAKGTKPAKSVKAHKTASRAPSAKPKKAGVPHAGSAFDPLNGSLP